MIARPSPAGGQVADVALFPFNKSTISAERIPKRLKRLRPPFAISWVIHNSFCPFSS
jgi:hypothetical protein